jgi:hypothetical protein
MAIVERERTSAKIVMYALYLYFLGLSFRNTSRALQPFVERSHVPVWEWVQRFDPKQVYLLYFREKLFSRVAQYDDIMEKVAPFALQRISLQ